MKDCRRCGSAIDDGAQFCPDCGAPQSDAAKSELAALARDELEPSQLPSGDGGGSALPGSVAGDPDSLVDRVAYAVGFVTLVLALALLFDPAAVPLFLAGVVILPPMRYLLARPVFGRPFIREFMVALYAVLAVVGGALFVLL
jgi:hypothetical protein